MAAQHAAEAVGLGFSCAGAVLDTSRGRLMRGRSLAAIR
jgi:hypothetical protein